MLVLLKGDCPVLATAGPWDRLLARLHARRLDGDLAAGVSPDVGVALALRARRLVSMQNRRDLARTVQRLLAAAMDPHAAARLPIPVCRHRVRGCTAELDQLIRRLLAPGPVSPQGVAKATALFTDATSPLYHWASRSDLRARIRAAVDALNPAWSPEAWTPPAAAGPPAGRRSLAGGVDPGPAWLVSGAAGGTSQPWAGTRARPAGWWRPMNRRRQR